MPLPRERVPARVLNSRVSFGRAGAERMRQASHGIAAHGYAACARSGRARKRWLMRNGCDLGRTLLLWLNNRSLCDVRVRSARMFGTGARRTHALPDSVAACPPRDDRRALRSLKVRP